MNPTHKLKLNCQHLHSNSNDCCIRDTNKKQFHAIPCNDALETNLKNNNDFPEMQKHMARALQHITTFASVYMRYTGNLEIKSKMYETLNNMSYELNNMYSKVKCIFSSCPSVWLMVRVSVSTSIRLKCVAVAFLKKTH